MKLFRLVPAEQIEIDRVTSKELELEKPLLEYMAEELGCKVTELKIASPEEFTECGYSKMYDEFEETLNKQCKKHKIPTDYEKLDNLGIKSIGIISIPGNKKYIKWEDMYFYCYFRK